MTNGFISMAEHQSEVALKEAKPSMEAVLAVIAANINLFQEQVNELIGAKFVQPDPAVLNLADDLQIVAARICEMLQD